MTFPLKSGAISTLRIAPHMKSIAVPRPRL
jgi:hypothetical protein